MRHIHINYPEEWGEPGRWWWPWTADWLEKYLKGRCLLTRSGASNPVADLNYHITWWKREGRNKTKIDVALFTHLNPIYGFDIKEALSFHDHLVAMSSHGEEILMQQGVPEDKITIIHCGVDGFAPRKLNIGISGRPYENYRKREYLLAELWWIMNPADFYALHFIFLGPDWEGIVDVLSAQGASVSYPKEVACDDYPRIFPTFDVYVNCAFAEGGPMGVIQALACGVPVISPDHGYGREFNTLHFETAQELAVHLGKMIKRPQYRQTWEQWAEGHRQLFERLIDGKEVLGHPD